MGSNYWSNLGPPEILTQVVVLFLVFLVLRKIHRVIYVWYTSKLFLSGNKLGVAGVVLVIMVALTLFFLKIGNNVPFFMIIIAFVHFHDTLSRWQLLAFRSHHLIFSSEILLYSEISQIRLTKANVIFYKNAEEYQAIDSKAFNLKAWHSLQERTRQFAQKNNVLLKEVYE